MDKDTIIFRLNDKITFLKYLIIFRLGIYDNIIFLKV